MFYIRAVHLAGGAGHEHIASVRWRNPQSGDTGESSKATMVDWINEGNVTKVQAGALLEGWDAIFGWEVEAA